MKQLNTYVVQSVKFSSLNFYHCTSSSVADRQLAKWLSTSSMVKLLKKKMIRSNTKLQIICGAISFTLVIPYFDFCVQFEQNVTINRNVYLGPKLFPHIGHWDTALWLASGSVFIACGEGCLPLVSRSTEVSDSNLELLMLALLSFFISGIMIYIV